jgi:adenine phosphoribosyltransferase
MGIRTGVPADQREVDIMDAVSGSAYTLKVAGLTRPLLLRQISPDVAIVSFIMLGDTELVEKTAAALYSKLPKYNIDILVCPETKAIPLAQELTLCSRLTMWW